MKGSTFLTFASAVILACSSNGEQPRGTGGTDTPTTTPVALLRFQGETLAFEYPASWHIWFHSQTLEQESVILANIPIGPGRGGLPEGAIKVDIVSRSDPERPPGDPPASAQRLNFPSSPVEYYSRRGAPGETAWVIQGQLAANGRLYGVSVYIETDPLPLDEVAPLLRTLRPLPR
jgi:hypothetical protein